LWGYSSILTAAKKGYGKTGAGTLRVEVIVSGKAIGEMQRVKLRILGRQQQLSGGRHHD
jgi:hypothetical protein